jgi:hypothetical protein
VAANAERYRIRSVVTFTGREQYAGVNTADGGTIRNGSTHTDPQ